MCILAWEGVRRVEEAGRGLYCITLITQFKSIEDMSFVLVWVSYVRQVYILGTNISHIERRSAASFNKQSKA